MIRIAAAQINPTVGDLKGNGQKIREWMDRARLQGADIIVFPELAVCGYPPEDLLCKDHFVQDNINELRAISKYSKNIVAVIGFVDRDKKGLLYNAAAVVVNGRLKGVYHKEALPNYGVFDEKRYFDSGKNNKIFAIEGRRFGVNICEDIWVNHGVFQKQVRAGAKLLINISCSPYDVGKLAERHRLLKRRAKESKAYICYVNLVGGQDELVFDGGSLVADPQGRIIASAKAFDEDLMIVDIGLPKPRSGSRTSSQVISVGSQIRVKSDSAKPSIQPKLSQDDRIYRALVLGTRDYARKNGFQKAVLGVSGGIDSSVVAAIAVDAFGKDNVIGVTMPSRYTSKGTYSDAKVLAKNLGIRLLEVPIEKTFEAYLRDMKDVIKGTSFGLGEENLQARIRGNIIMTLSNKFGWLVLTTGNKSEMAVGYCTLYGDMSGGFAVIKDVPKTKVYGLAALRNNMTTKMDGSGFVFYGQDRGRGIIPQGVIQRPPSAELRDHQTDHDSLPPYDALDAMLADYVERHASLAQMARHNDRELVKEVVTLVDRSEYKRRQAPPGIKITPRAFGKDWRLPITSHYKEF